MNPLTVVVAVATTDNSISWTNRFTLSFVNTDLIQLTILPNIDSPFYDYDYSPSFAMTSCVITVLGTTHSTASVALE